MNGEQLVNILTAIGVSLATIATLLGQIAKGRRSGDGSHVDGVSRKVTRRNGVSQTHGQVSASPPPKIDHGG